MRYQTFCELCSRNRHYSYVKKFYPCNASFNSTNLKILFDQIKILEIEMGSVFYTHIPRENNFKADSLANKALDTRY